MDRVPPAVERQSTEKEGWHSKEANMKLWNVLI